MGYLFNPITGDLDLTGNVPPAITVSPRYTQSITIPNWLVNGPDYSITILQTTHLKNTTSSVVCFEEVSPGVFDQVYPSVTINTAGDVIVKVTQVPDLRFVGKLIII